jgi:acyl carrier protein
MSDAATGTDRQPAPAAVDEQSILATVAGLIVDVIGDEFLLDAPVTRESSFAEDLELESIEFVALSERLLEHYGEGVDFIAWLSDMEVEEIIALTVGELVDFIATCQS